MTIKEILKSDACFIMKYVDGEEKLAPVEMAVNTIIFILLKFLKKNIKMSYSITNFYVNGMFGKSTLIDSYSYILEDIFKDGIPLDFRFEDGVTEIIQSGILSIQNDIALDSVEYEGSILLSELLSIQLEPSLMEAINKLDEEPNPRNVDKVFLTVKDIMFSDKFKSNSVAIAYMSESVSPRQLNQCLGVRGYAFDLNNQIYQKPIATSYTLGLRDMCDVAKESRGAAIALRNSSDAIAKSETFAKDMQMICSIVDKLERTDCGATDGIKLLVESGMVPTIHGQYYKMNIEDEWKLLKIEDTHLEGKIIIIRTTLSCQLEDDSSVCIRCYGNFGFHVSAPKPGYKGFNIGHWSSSKVTSPASQSLLSTKYYLTSADGGTVTLSGEDRAMVMVKDNRLRLTKNLLSVGISNINIRINEEYLDDLKNLSVDLIDTSIDIWSISKIDKFTIEITDKNGIISNHLIDLSTYGKHLLVTKSFVKHILRKKYKLESNEFVIPLKGFSPTAVLFIIPDTVFDYNEYNVKLRSILQKSKTPEGESITNTKELLVTVHRFVNSKLYCHISAIAMIAYSMSVKNRLELDFNLNRCLESDIATSARILHNRSSALIIAYGSTSQIFNTVMVGNKKSAPHPLTVIFEPQEVLKGLK